MKQIRLWWKRWRKYTNPEDGASFDHTFHSERHALEEFETFYRGDSNLRHIYKFQELENDRG